MTTWSDIGKTKEFVPLGTFWSGDWTVPEQDIYAATTGRDRLELLRTSTYSNSTVLINTNLFILAVNVLTDAGLTVEEYFVDPELQNYNVPYSYFESQTHREALRKISEACLGQCYCDRNGIVRVEGPSYLDNNTSIDTITMDDYFSKDNPVSWSQIANYIEVETQPLRPSTAEEVYASNEAVSITAGETKTITAYYNSTPCINAAASLTGTGTIAEATYYAWGATVKVTSATAGTFTLSIVAQPLKVLNKDKAIAQDNSSIVDNGKITYTFQVNPLIQTLAIAQTIANNLLSYYKDPRRDVEIDWRGNPAMLLGDRVTVTDKLEQNDYYIVKQELEFDGALRAKLSGRKV